MINNKNTCQVARVKYLFHNKVQAFVMLAYNFTIYTTVRIIPIGKSSVFLSNKCFLPTFLNLTLPSNTQRLSVKGETFNIKAASFRVKHSFAWITFTSSSVTLRRTASCQRLFGRIVLQENSHGEK